MVIKKHHQKNGIWLPLVFLSLACLFLSGGCLPKPYFPGKDLGTLRLRIIKQTETPPNEQQFSPMSQSLDLATLEIILTNNKLEIKKVVPYAEEQEIIIDSIYPGTWDIEVKGYDPTGKWILYGVEKDQPISPGETVLVSLIIGLAPGSLTVMMDVSLLLEKGYDVSSGRFYVFEDANNDNTTQFDLVLVGSILKNEEKILLPQGTYEVFVAIPNKSNSIYKSDPRRIDVISGEPGEFDLTADANLLVEGYIDLPPATPENFRVSPDGNRVELSWDRVPDPDVLGYYIYRTNTAGRFVIRDNVSGREDLSYVDSISPKDFFNNRIGYAVSSYDLHNVSIWSKPIYLDPDLYIIEVEK